MRESIGTTWVMQLVLGFILLFVAFLTLTLGYSKSYKVKNETLSIIEKYEGLTEDAVKIINNYLEYNGYTAMGKCIDDTWYGVENLSVYKLEKAEADKKYYYCVKKCNTQNDKYKNFYEVHTFFKFNLPIIGDFATFKIEGSTADFRSMDSYSGYN